MLSYEDINRIVLATLPLTSLTRSARRRERAVFSR